MRILKSKVNRNSASFKQRYAHNLNLLHELESKMQDSRFQGKEKYTERARKKGKLLARERIDLLLDKDSPFLELMPLAACKRKDVNTGGTVLTGIGLVKGKLVGITSNIGTIKGGAIDYTTLQKSFRFNEIAFENELPVVNLVESAGANLPEQAKIFNRGGANFRDISRRSEAKIPTISVVFGNSTAGGAYVPGMSDYTVMIKENAKVFLAGPPLVKMATNEVTDAESLGGAAMHSKVSGVSDYLAENEQEGIRIAREIIGSLPEKKKFQAKKVDEPAFDADEILGIIPEDIKTAFDVREVIARIVDGSRFGEFKADYGASLVCGFADIHGYPVGIIANNGVLFSDSANKGAQFIQLCNQQDRPLLFLQNITGFMVGKKYEQEGIIKHGAKLINAVSNSKVPAFTVMIGASYGAGNYAMCGRAYEPRLLFGWPNYKIAVMGPEQLGGVMELIGRQAAAKAGVIYDEQGGAMMRDAFVQKVNQESDAWYATSNLWDDGIIDPRETRNYLGFGLAMAYTKEVKGAQSFGVFRM